MSNRSGRRGLAAVVMLVALAACSSPAGAPSASSPGEPTPGTEESAVPAIVIEDAGIETELAPGRYESRLFEPHLSFELGEGWFRRDAGRDRTLNLRRLPEGAADLTFISRLDFLQCGDNEVIEQPDAAAIVAGLTGSDALDTTEPVEVPVGERTATMVRLNGGEALPGEDLNLFLDFGCVITIGEAPFPADGGWITFTRPDVMQVAVLDVDDTTILIRARPDDDPESFFDLALEVMATATFD